MTWTHFRENVHADKDHDVGEQQDYDCRCHVNVIIIHGQHHYTVEGRKPTATYFYLLLKSNFLHVLP